MIRLSGALNTTGGQLALYILHKWSHTEVCSSMKGTDTTAIHTHRLTISAEQWV